VSDHVIIQLLFRRHEAGILGKKRGVGQMARQDLSCVLEQLRRLTGPGLADELTDGELLDQFVALREEAAFEILVRRHGPLVWAVCRRVLRSDHDAEDVFQATFLVLARRAHSIRKRQSIGSWLYGVALRLARRLQSDQSRRRAHEQRIVPIAPGDPACETAARDSARVVAEEVGRLPEKYRAAVVLRYMAGRTNEQAALELSWPVGTVKTRVARALQMLERRLIRRGLALSAGGAVTLLAEHQATAVVPARLLGTTILAAVRFVSTSAALPTSASALRLAQEAVRAFSLARVRNLILLLAAGVLLAGGGIVARTQRAEPTLESENLAAARPPLSSAPGSVLDPAGAALPPNAFVPLGSQAFLHSREPATVVFSPDGKWLLSGGPGEPLRLWKRDTGQEIRRFTGHESNSQYGLFSLVLSPDGKLVAARSHADARVYVWQTDTGRVLARFAPEGGGALFSDSVYRDG
jgi:RNA polymerase sigma-70 factor (ECF subfamily)